MSNLLPNLFVAAGFATALLATSPSAASAFELPDWASEHYRSHPLAGSVWRGDGSEADLDEVAGAAATADYVLVGETHPNPDHHRLQAKFIRALLVSGRRPAVVFEMVPAGLQTALDAYVRDNPSDAAGLGAALDWEARGWPAWEIYQPIAEAALEAGLPMRAGDLDREVIRTIGRQGAAALDQPDRERLGLDVPLSADHEADLLENLRVSHCDLLPEQMLKPMLTVQRARDGALAAAMIDAVSNDAGTDGAVLIAGAGHTRTDWAAPAVLDRLAPGAKVVSIGLIEVEDGQNAFADYADAPDAPEARYDFVIFTPRSEVKDHCAELGERFANPAKSD